MIDKEPTSLAESAARLRLTREALGLTQAELCRRAGIDRQVWNNAETGDNRISVPEAVKLARMTGVSLDWIYRGIRVNLPDIIREELIRREQPTEQPRRRARASS